MTNSAFSAAERHYLAEPDRCERCGGETTGHWLCEPCADQEYEAELQATEGNERTKS